MAVAKVSGFSTMCSRGVRSGTVVDMEATQSAILSAVHAAEQMAEEAIDRVVINLSGGFPVSFSMAVEVSIAGHEVGDADLRRALAHGFESESVSDEAARGRQLIHSIPISYTIDGSAGIRDPRGMFGERLGVNMHLITAGNGPVRNLNNCIERCHLDVAGFALSPYTSGLATLAEDERIVFNAGTPYDAIEMDYVDFERLDLSEFARDLMDGSRAPSVSLPDAGDTRDAMRTRIGDFYRRGQ